MKVILIAFFFVFNFVFAQDEKCKEALNNSLKMEQCCKMPHMIEESDILETAKKLEKKYQNNPGLMACMLNQELLKKIGLENLDREPCKNFAMKVTKEPWTTIVINAEETCNKKLSKYIQLIQPIYNVTSDQCDLKYGAFVNCIHITIFGKCPTESFTASPKCDNSKYVVNECEDDEVFLKYLNQQ
ncbi:hypothetical protein PVAND_000213 [Polypedilum vanderplanki]|uniref:Uncharacterized protein n=1 Tax=Polypedilum vanderplanki TaxID=319348 RepID=A0A9J6BK77_POLVA|nr:hypothetical protein PVAND_000213 [Polypedilum vanderplanki]